jgi:hypothetical protein
MQFIARVLCLVFVFCVTSVTCYAEDNAKDTPISERKRQNNTSNKNDSSDTSKKVEKSKKQIPQYKKAKQERDGN